MKNEGYHKYLHNVAMLTIVLGAMVLFYLSFLWYQQDKMVMGLGMFAMALIASSNFYLHWRVMKKSKH